MKLSELKKLVVIEATALKEKATKAEIANLNRFDFDPTIHTECIYGQMTGSCFNTRATELITSCASKLLDGQIGNYITPIEIREATDLLQRRTAMYDYRWSPIEVFIAVNKNSKNIDKLFDFLSGERTKLF